MHIKHSKPFIDNKEAINASKVIQSGNHATGEIVKEFEKKTASLLGHKYTKATNSGASAIHIALLAFDVKGDDEVIIPSYACQALLNTINYTKATPVIADIDTKTLSLSVETIKHLITNKTKAIIVPHMFGIPTEINNIIDLAKKHNIAVIEDSAQSLLSYLNKDSKKYQKIITTCSFYATKIISTGHGGMILTSSKKLKEKIDDFTKYDQKANYTIGFNYKMTDIQAAIGVTQLEKVDSFIKKRRDIAIIYNKAFKNLPISFIDYQNGFPFRYLIKFKLKEEKDSIMKILREKGIDTENPVFKPLHQYLNLDKKSFKNTIDAHDTYLSIPLYPALTEDEIKYTIDIVRKCF